MKKKKSFNTLILFKSSIIYYIMKKINLPKNHYLLFSPFLIFYIVIILLTNNNILIGDEHRYVDLATSLLHGSLATYNTVDILTNCPGYPLIILPIIALKLPHIIFGILNIILYTSIISGTSSNSMLRTRRFSCWSSWLDSRFLSNSFSTPIRSF